MQGAILHTLDILNNFVLGARAFSETEQAYYREPFLVPAEDRRPMLFDFAIDGMLGIMIDADPGYLLKGRLYDFAHKWPNQTEGRREGHPLHAGHRPA
jgi:haloalkane dehalogenase